MKKYKTTMSIVRNILIVVVALLMAGCGDINTTGTHNSDAAESRDTFATKATGNAPGLLIIAHGAPSPKWNEPVLALQEQVIDALNMQGNPFKKVKICMMEFAKPTVADGVAEMERAGCDRIVVVPLLIAPSSHSHWDIPALLGLYSDEELENELKEEGATIIRPRIPIVITPPLSKSNLIPEIMLDRVKALSTNPANEALVILAHGDDFTMPLWQGLMKRIAVYICSETGISYADWAFVHVGQSYSHAINVITGAAANRERVIIVGSYVSMGVTAMHQRFMRMAKHAMKGMDNPLDDIDIVTADNGLIPDPRLAKWIAETARKEIIRHKTD